MTGWDFSGQNLTKASLHESTLTNANLAGANLTDANLTSSRLTNANLAGAVVTGASLGDTTSRGFTQAQLASTASFQTKNLQGIELWSNNLTGWDFSGQNLTGASLSSSTLTNANLAEANLTNANLEASRLTNADLTGADTRGAQYLDLTGATVRNTILPDGTIAGLNLAAGEQLVVRDDDGVSDPPAQYWVTPRLPIPINIQDRLMMSDGGSLQLLFDADAWDSTISFQPGIPVTLGGNLELSFATDVDLASQIGRTFHIFDWTGAQPTGTFTVSSLYRWDVSQLYSTGEITLVPEPRAFLLAACALAAAMVPRIRRRRVR